MFDVIDSLRAGFAHADRGLALADRAIAQAEAGGRRGADAAMAEISRVAIFTEALLGATRARLQEIVTAVKA